MKTTVGKLRGMVKEAKISASASYMKKEKCREGIQKVISDAVAAGDVKDQAELDELLNAADMALKSLKMIPYDVWQRMSKLPKL